MSEFANLHAEAQGFVTDYLLTDDQRDDVLRLIPKGNTINLDRGARIIQALLDILENVAAARRGDYDGNHMESLGRLAAEIKHDRDEWQEAWERADRLEVENERLRGEVRKAHVFKPGVVRPFAWCAACGWHGYDGDFAAHVDAIMNGTPA